MTKSATISQNLNEVMADHKLDLIGYDGYDAEIIGHANDDLMRGCLWYSILFLYWVPSIVH